MKKLVFLSVFLLSGIVALAQESYVMFETMYIDVKPDKIDEFEEAFKAHNKKFHAEGASMVTAHYMINGPHEGQIGWVMGPLTFTDLDSRPSGDDHGKDRNMVMPYVKKVSEVEYWRQDKDLRYAPEDVTFSKYHMRYFDVKDGKWKEVSKVLGQVVEVYRSKSYKQSMTIYWNQFNTGNGREVVAVQGFTSYSEYDEDDTWVEDFESIHGEGSWEKAYADIVAATDGMTEELREVLVELGGASE
jgi:hypothetical protein